ncbi:hypothetical protein ACTXT7_012688 [Hymenolepis weldensis]
MKNVSFHLQIKAVHNPPQLKTLDLHNGREMDVEMQVEKVSLVAQLKTWTMAPELTSVSALSRQELPIVYRPVHNLKTPRPIGHPLADRSNIKVA